MSMMKKTFFNPELNTYDTYTDTWIVEKVSVKDEKDLLVLNHYWCDSDGELWGDFENPMENVYRSFDAYRERKGWMTPKEIKDLRKSLGFSVRKFADALEISPSTLTQIENNHRVQAKYQEILFTLAVYVIEPARPHYLRVSGVLSLISGIISCIYCMFVSYDCVDE